MSCRCSATACAVQVGRHRLSGDFILDAQGQSRVDCLISTLSYSMGSLTVQGATIAEGWSVEFLEQLNVPIVQAIACTTSHADVGAERCRADAAGYGHERGAARV